MNSISLIGNVGNFELRYTQQGDAILNFSLAVKRSFKKEGHPDTDWFSCSVFGKRAEALSKFFDKGLKLGVVGRAEWREWLDKQDNKRKDLSVFVNELTLLGSPNRDRADMPAQDRPQSNSGPYRQATPPTQYPNRHQQAPQQPQAMSQTQDLWTEDNIPF